jgi:putative nucleotidyltransferase with HDIG domain
MKDYKLTNLLRKHHPDTYYHSLRVSHLCFQVAKKLSLSNDNCVKVMQAGLLHDIGKLAVPAYILSMPTRPNEQEFAVIKQHVVVGVNILRDLNYDQDILASVAGHHEREDGSGYPKMSTSSQNHEFSKIVAVCDVYDAMTETRSYKKALEKNEVLLMMKNDIIGVFHKQSLIALSDVSQESMDEVLKFKIN